MISVFDREEKNVGKKENAGYHNVFYLLQIQFQLLCHIYFVDCSINAFNLVQSKTCCLVKS